MHTYEKHYINGTWIHSTGNETIEVINPATEKVVGRVSHGTAEDVNRAVQAAKEAFDSFSQTTVEERIHLLEKIAKEYEKRKDDFIDIITKELGAPLRASESSHYKMGLAHFQEAAEQLRTFTFEERRKNAVIRKEAIGVSALITPWNFPTNQTATKLASALAAGCTVVLKPSELTPLAAGLLAEVLDAAGVPKGVFNLVNGTGELVGNTLTSHPDVEKVSFTGSVQTGAHITKNSADTIKKVSLELGGKSPLIVLDDFDIETAAKIATANVVFNCGQVCSLASRTLVPKEQVNSFIQFVKAQLMKYRAGDPLDENTRLGPLVSQAQFERVQHYIQIGIDEGANLVAGGLGKPEGIEKGYYVKPTVFTDVTNDMTIAQEEIFGPVMSIIPYETVDEAIEIANDTVYGLAGYVLGENKETIEKVAHALRAGRVVINGARADFSLPFGGYKQSGVGREWGDYGIDEYLEVKSIVGL